MRESTTKFLVGDFETTVYKGQTDTEVWASAIVELFTDDVKIFHSIDETFKYLVSLNSNIVCYYHNLKFDGSFWLSYFLVDQGMKQALETDENGIQGFIKPRDMLNNTVSYSIAGMGVVLNCL